MAPRVLVLSPPRMGTQSVADALMILGYDRVYHMREVGKNGHAQQWADLLHAKFGEQSRQLQRKDFEPLLGDFDALADFPASIFAEDLIRLYPQAKVILLQRDEDAWFRSMESTFSRPRSAEEKQSPMQPLREAYQKYCWKDDLATYGREYLRNYKALVRAKTPQERLLEFPTTGEWEPLCRFLGKDIPDVAYPNRDDHRDWKAERQARS